MLHNRIQHRFSNNLKPKSISDEAKLQILQKKLNNVKSQRQQDKLFYERKLIQIKKQEIGLLRSLEESRQSHARLTDLN